MTSLNRSIIKPVIRWAGGKTWLLKHINQLLMGDYEYFIEPFLGGASVFLHVIQNNPSVREFYLSDCNRDMIRLYLMLQTRADDVIHVLSEFVNTEEAYYRIRSWDPSNDVEKAAQLLYLNRTCFNGLYRTNRQNRFNVPYGHKKYRVLFDYENILGFSELIKRAVLSANDFDESRVYVRNKGLVFLDPPYTVAHNNNHFVKYNQTLFSWQDQIRLSEYLGYISFHKAHFIMTNAYHESTIELFQKHGMASCVARASVIGSLPKYRRTTSELIITNISCPSIKQT